MSGNLLKIHILKNEKGSMLLFGLFTIFLFSLCLLYVAGSYKSSYEITKNIAEKERLSAISAYLFEQLKTNISEDIVQVPVKKNYQVETLTISYDVQFIGNLFSCTIIIISNDEMWHKKTYTWE